MEPNKVLTYIDSIDNNARAEKSMDTWRNSEEYKTRQLAKEADKAKGLCLDKLFAKVYKDAIPLNDEYKVARGEDLDAEIHDFMSARCPEGMEYYVKEAIKNGSVPCKKMMEAVNNIVDQYRRDKVLNLKNLGPDELAFQMDDENLHKLNVIADDLSFDDVSAAISTNVKQTAAAEIARSKDEKEKSEQLEKELKDDLSVTDEDQIQQKLESVTLSDDPIYTPTLFEGIMIGNTSKYRAMEESGEFDDGYEYNALSTFGIQKGVDNMHTSVVEKAFIESVKEMTKLQILKAFKMESFTHTDINHMAEKYCYMESSNEKKNKNRFTDK